MKPGPKPKRKRNAKPVGGGGARHPNSLANLKQAPPAKAGNRQHVTHGGFAQVARERLEVREQEIADALSLDVPLRDEDGGAPRHDALAIRLLAEALCRLQDVKQYLSDYGWLDETTNEPKTAVDVEQRLRREALDLAESLGMTPRSRSRLGLTLAQTADLVQTMIEIPTDDERALEIPAVLERAGGLPPGVALPEVRPRRAMDVEGVEGVDERVREVPREQ